MPFSNAYRALLRVTSSYFGIILVGMKGTKAGLARKMANKTIYSPCTLRSNTLLLAGLVIREGFNSSW